MPAKAKTSDPEGLWERGTGRGSSTRGIRLSLHRTILMSHKFLSWEHSSTCTMGLVQPTDKFLSCHLCRNA